MHYKWRIWEKFFPFRDGYQAKKKRCRQFFDHTMFKFIFKSVIKYVCSDQSLAKTILSGLIWLILLVFGSLKVFPQITSVFELRFLDFGKLIKRVWKIFWKKRSNERSYMLGNTLGRQEMT